MYAGQITAGENLSSFFFFLQKAAKAFVIDRSLTPIISCKDFDVFWIKVFFFDTDENSV